MATKTAPENDVIVSTGDDAAIVNVDLPDDNTDGFTETTELPTGRKARMIPTAVWDRLEESARRRVGFSKTGSKKVIDELRKDLASAAVKAKFDVTTGSKDAGKGQITLTFSATAKVQE
jgi:hypothetical protein